YLSATRNAPMTRNTMTLRTIRPLALVAAFALAAACGDGDGSTGLDPDQYELVAVSGSGQSGIARTVLPEPMVVTVRRLDTGAGEKGVSLSWSVTQGNGEPTRGSAVTDEDGRASTRLVLGSAGDHQVRASVAGLDPVFIGSLTSLPAPAIQSLPAGTVAPDDTIDVIVSDLEPGMPVEVLFDGVAGVIAERQDGSPATLATVVPAPVGACPGTRAVDVRLRVDGFSSATRSLTVSVPAEPFQVGQVLVMQGSSEVDCALLPADGGTAKYLLVALSAEFENDGNFQVTLGASGVAFQPVDGFQPSVRSSLDTRLRAFEQRLLARGRAVAPRPARTAQLFAQPQVGSTRQFWVINNLDSLDGDLGAADFDRVTATLEYVGVHSLLYVDDAAPAQGLTESDIQRLGDLYDHILYESDVDFFGEPSDVDNNDQVIILLSPTVNGLTPEGSEGIVVGFFFGLDLFDPSTPNCSDCQFSNDGELFYGLVPDPDGDFSDPRSRTFVNQVLPGVMIHETEHMINFNFKVFVNRLSVLEELWLSEGLAHMAEELGGDEADAAGDITAADNLYATNFGRAFQFLEDPSASSLTVVDGNGTLGERGAAWLFLRWLAEQYGDFFIRGLAQAPEQGVENVEARTGESFFRLFADWAVALWADDLEIPDLAARYQIPKWTLRS
ncbi:MAG TPA: hypothetical protein VLA23_08050, partial [Candidatus Limnocylindrales bacterium]|nr:hypothetical protein [Candidatus Limnocylindrales bacterium]